MGNLWCEYFRLTALLGVVTETDVLTEVTATHQPKTGGIHSREAAQHHAIHTAVRVLTTLA